MKETNELSNEEAMMLLILALMEEVDSLKTKVYILYGLLVIGGILWIW